jgi:hypothetical protein
MCSYLVYLTLNIIFSVVKSNPCFQEACSYKLQYNLTAKDEDWGVDDIVLHLISHNDSQSHSNGKSPN